MPMRISKKGHLRPDFFFFRLSKLPFKKFILRKKFIIKISFLLWNEFFKKNLNKIFPKKISLNLYKKIKWIIFFWSMRIHKKRPSFQKMCQTRPWSVFFWRASNSLVLSKHLNLKLSSDILFFSKPNQQRRTKQIRHNWVQIKKLSEIFEFLRIVRSFKSALFFWTNFKNNRKKISQSLDQLVAWF